MSRPKYVPPSDKTKSSGVKKQVKVLTPEQEKVVKLIQDQIISLEKAIDEIYEA